MTAPQDIRGLTERLRAPDWHDPACPFKKHCYCDDGAPHDRVTHPDGLEAATALESLDTLVGELVSALRAMRDHPDCPVQVGVIGDEALIKARANRFTMGDAK